VTEKKGASARGNAALQSSRARRRHDSQRFQPEAGRLRLRVRLRRVIRGGVVAELKLLHVTGGLEPALGGPAVGILNYIAAAVRQGIDSHLLAAIDDPDSPLGAELHKRADAEHYAITLVRRTGRFKGRASRWGISIPLAAWLSRNADDFDVIVMHGAWMFSSLAALFFGRLHGKACVLVPHESLTEFDVHKKGIRARVIAKKLLKRIYSRYCNLFCSPRTPKQSKACGRMRRRSTW
jgi:hypothetical protein